MNGIRENPKLNDTLKKIYTYQIKKSIPVINNIKLTQFVDNLMK